MENYFTNIIILPFYEKLNVEREISSLEDINIKHIENLKEIQELKNISDNYTTLIISFCSSLLIIILIMVALMILKYKKFKNKIPVQVFSELQEKSESNGGGVTAVHATLDPQMVYPVLPSNQ